jgi:hypothetical protein
MGRAVDRLASATRLSAGAVMVLSLIRGWCRASAKSRGEPVAVVSVRRLAELTGRSIRTAHRYVAELRAAGAIAVEPGERDSGGCDWNRYRVTPPVNDDRGPPVNDDRGPPVKDDRGPPVKDDRAPPYMDLAFTQQQLSAAAAAIVHSPEEGPAAGPVPGPDVEGEPERPDLLAGVLGGKTAAEALLAAGLTAEAAAPFAAADRGGLCALAAAYYGEVSARKAAAGRPCGLGLLVEFLRNPKAYFWRDDRSDDPARWLPPRDSMIYKSLKAAEKAVVAAERRARQAQAEATQRERDRRQAAACAADPAEWAALAESDRCGIENGVHAQYPVLTPGGELFLRNCYRWMRGLLAAHAQEAAWQALPEATRAEIEAEARRLFPLWAASPGGLHSACLTVAAARAADAEARAAVHAGEVPNDHGEVAR